MREPVKNDLLRTIGFSEAYISYLERADHQVEVYDLPLQDYAILTTDLNSVILEKPRTDFVTNVIVQRKE